LLDGWRKNYPLLNEAYHLKESFYGIYDAPDREEAISRYEVWRKSIPPEVFADYSDLVRAFENWMPQILNYFSHPVMNAYTESLNSLIRVMNRVGRGYSFEALRAKMLFSEGVHKHKLPKPKFVRKPMDAPKPPREKRSDTMMDFCIGYVSAPVGYENTKSTIEPERKKSYGADLSTLAALIERGDF
jgi:hypothetical protein